MSRPTARQLKKWDRQTREANADHREKRRNAANANGTAPDHEAIVDISVELYDIHGRVDAIPDGIDEAESIRLQRALLASQSELALIFLEALLRNHCGEILTELAVTRSKSVSGVRDSKLIIWFDWDDPMKLIRAIDLIYWELESRTQKPTVETPPTQQAVEETYNPKDYECENKVHVRVSKNIGGWERCNVCPGCVKSAAWFKEQYPNGMVYRAEKVN